MYVSRAGLEVFTECSKVGGRSALPCLGFALCVSNSTVSYSILEPMWSNFESKNLHKCSVSVMLSGGIFPG